ncbi:MAG: histidine--tRNA ligase, partial [Mogibacterium sp.]|nr:histidine--tRNA ligase [Mogibacterium sp.]
MAIKAPKGTKDVMPQDSYKWRYIESEWDKICAEYGFEEMRTPTFESTELFCRGVGDTTDIVQKEMYTFEDMGHRSITLKPEGTSPAVRAFIESNQYAETQPSKYYYNTPCFRYEKPQAGRLREFHQFGIENFGTSDMLADAEVIALASDFLERMGIQDVELHISSVGCRCCRPLHRKALQEFLQPKYEELCETCKDRFDKNPMRILDCKSPVCKELVQGAPMMLDYLCDDCKKSLDELKSHLDAMDINYIVDPSIVRGLDYYT